MKLKELNMKKNFLMIIGFIIIFSVSACSSNPSAITPNMSSTIPSEDTNPTTNSKENEYMKSLEMKIGDTILFSIDI